MLKITTLIVSCLLILSGCSSFKPHQINLQPIHPDIGKNLSLPKNLNVAVESRDVRSSPLIGFRLGRFSDRAEVNLPIPATTSLTEGGKVAIVKLGATPIPDNGDATVTLTLQNISYTATQNALQQVDISATIQLSASKNGDSFTGNYATDKQHLFATTPSLETNEKIINELIVLTVSRAFNDPRLVMFLRAP
ncbi:MAG: YajG family lipoprotein [Amphritea sp.]